ncbi:hypothetical protein K7432_011174 [Basidiobolus ranarum]|uniref:Uncharacterized protein n=1 Tax=Basidiobolus ranarum TaxID=34480 RepID=A0ABR2VUB0_9FUNG
MEDLNISPRASTGYIRASLGHIFGDAQLIAQGRTLVSQAQTDFDAAQEKYRFSTKIDQLHGGPSPTRNVLTDATPLISA